MTDRNAARRACLGAAVALTLSTDAFASASTLAAGWSFAPPPAIETLRLSHQAANRAARDLTVAADGPDGVLFDSIETGDAGAPSFEAAPRADGRWRDRAAPTRSLSAQRLRMDAVGAPILRVPFAPSPEF